MIVKSKWFSAGDGRSISYDTAQEVAAFLFEHLDLIPGYNDSMYDQAKFYAAWRDLKGMRECLNLLVDVHVELAKLSDSDFLA